jgi:AraC-like DNA-binding protein
MMESYSADALPAASRATAWNDLYSQALNRVEFTPEDRHSFAARLSLGRLGPIQFVRMSTNRTDIRRTRRHIVPGAPRLYSFLLQAKGSSVFQHCGQEARLTEGDFTLCDSAAPHSFAVEDRSTVIMLRVDGATLARAPADARAVLRHAAAARGGAHRADVGDDREARRPARGRLHLGLRREHRAPPARDDGDVLRDRVRGASRPFGGDQGAPGRSRAHIEDRLRDPKLSPASVAEGLRISPRYLRTVFAGTGEKVSAYIIRRRLEECAKQIRNPAWAGHTLTEIAFAWGFNSAAHFTRTFHEQFGMAPREYRRVAQH